MQSDVANYHTQKTNKKHCFLFTFCASRTQHLRRTTRSPATFRVSLDPRVRTATTRRVTTHRSPNSRCLRVTFRPNASSSANVSTQSRVFHPRRRLAKPRFVSRLLYCLPSDILPSALAPKTFQKRSYIRRPYGPTDAYPSMVSTPYISTRRTTIGAHIPRGTPH